MKEWLFQSTPPVREATEAVDLAFDLTYQFQSTPPVREATLWRLPLMKNTGLFQSTPPVREATRKNDCWRNCEGFQSTPPVREATVTALLVPGEDEISIHASREGGDRQGHPLPFGQC